MRQWAEMFAAKHALSQSMNLLFDDADTETLAAALARCDLSPSARALFHTVRFWNAVAVVAVSIGFVLAAVLVIATAVLAALLPISMMAPVGCALAAVGCVVAHRGSQWCQRRLFARMLRRQRLVDSNISGVASVALPALRE